MGIIDVVRMCERMTNADPAWLRTQLWPINALFVVVETGLYPYWLDSLRPATDQQVLREFWTAVEPVLRAEWKNMTIEICRSIGEKMLIPEYIIDFVLDNMFDTIWDIIWDLTRPLFRGKE